MGIFLLKPNHKVKVFSFSSFFQFLDFEFHILPKVEVKENFPRFPSFRSRVLLLLLLLAISFLLA